MTAPLHLAEAFLLLALRDDGKRFAQRRDVDTGLAGAVLSDLVVVRAIDLDDDDGVVVTATKGAIDPFLAPFVDQIAGESRRRSAKHWVRKFRSAELRGAVEQSLVAKGLVVEQSAKTLGLIPTVRFPTTHSITEQQVSAQIAAVLAGDQQPDEWSASLIAICDATKVLKKVFGSVSKARLREITEGEWASAAVKRIIKQANAAVQAAVIATVAANGSNSGN